MAEPPLLKASLRHRLGALQLDAEFALTSPWTMLFGPSGSGKSTVLRAIAGFVHPDQGEMLYGNTTLLSTEKRVSVPAHARPVRSAGQGAPLFGHMDVPANVRYGLGRGSKLEDGAAAVTQALRLFRLESLLEQKPRELSGGERQRVAIARAAVAAVTFNGPGRALLLLDEPFAGLDTALRDELAPELRDWLRDWKTPVLSVSHHVGEAFLLGAEVIRMAEGRVVEQGPVEQVLRGERERLLVGLGAAVPSQR